MGLKIQLCNFLLQRTCALSIVCFGVITGLTGCEQSDDDTPLNQKPQSNEVFLNSATNATFLANASKDKGRLLFEHSMCSECHGNKGDGAISTGSIPINMLDLKHTQSTPLELAQYIEAQMPTSLPKSCEGQCAADTAMYLISWINETSRTSSSTTSQSSPISTSTSSSSSSTNSRQTTSRSSQATSSQSSSLRSSSSSKAPLPSSSSSSSKASSSSSSARIASGATLYEEMCLSCHGEKGQGSYEIIADNWSFETLSAKIHDTMPLGNVSGCLDDCADAIAEFMIGWQSKQACESPEQLLPRRLRLLTPREYQLTTNDIFSRSMRTNFAKYLPVTETVRGYDNNVPEIFASNVHITQYWAAAETISESVNLESVYTCVSNYEPDCEKEWIRAVGRKLFRRPLSDAEVVQYRQLYLSESDPDDSKRVTLKGMLMSPNFIYRSELGEQMDNGQYRLTPYEIASLLSYTYWGTTPDALLLEAAEADQLSTQEQIRQQVIRLLKSDRAKDQFVYFAKQWLQTTETRHIPKNSELFPDFTLQVSTAMDDEQIAFIENSFLDPNTTYADLFTSDTLWLNQVLADFYDIAGVTSSQLVETPATDDRGGILNLGAVLVSHAKMNQTSPIARGVFVRERLLCQTFPDPPPNAGDIIPLNNNLSTRERFTAHTDNDGCRDCHEKIDPIGFSFERYDATGRYREDEAGQPIDDRGSITGIQRMSDTDFWPYEGTKGLSELLANSPHSAACFVDQYQTFVQGVADPDGCGRYQLAQQWSDRDYRLYDLWVQTALQPSFILRSEEIAQ